MPQDYIISGFEMSGHAGGYQPDYVSPPISQTMELAEQMSAGMEDGPPSDELTPSCVSVVIETYNILARILYAGREEDRPMFETQLDEVTEHFMSHMLSHFDACFELYMDMEHEYNANTSAVLDGHEQRLGDLVLLYQQCHVDGQPTLALQQAYQTAYMEEVIRLCDELSALVYEYNDADSDYIAGTKIFIHSLKAQFDDHVQTLLTSYQQ